MSKREGRRGKERVCASNMTLRRPKKKTAQSDRREHERVTSRRHTRVRGRTGEGRASQRVGRRQTESLRGRSSGLTQFSLCTQKLSSSRWIFWTSDLKTFSSITSKGCL